MTSNLITTAVKGVLRGALAPYVITTALGFAIYEIGRADERKELLRKFRKYEAAVLDVQRKASMN